MDFGNESGDNAYSDMMKLNIIIYTSLGQNLPEVEINNSRNTGVINFLWRHYKGL